MNIELPEYVQLTECWARDGLQNQEAYISTESKQEMINKIIDAGFKRIEVTSFSHPKYVPQFKDAELLLKTIKKNKNVSYKATCVNKKALLRALDTVNSGYGPDEVSFVLAASESYNKINVKMSQQELLMQIKDMISLAKKAGLEVLISISTAFGCPYQGEIKENKIIELVKYFSEQGVNKITIGDTTGMANPKKSYQLFSNLKKLPINIPLIAHFHDTKGWGIANAYAALQAGINYFDVSLGGIGGPPNKRLEKQNNNTGNVCTEDFIYLLNDLNIQTNISLEKIKEAGKYSEYLLGEKQRSQILRSLG